MVGRHAPHMNGAATSSCRNTSKARRTPPSAANELTVWPQLDPRQTVSDDAANPPKIESERHHEQGRSADPDTHSERCPGRARRFAAGRCGVWVDWGRRRYGAHCESVVFVAATASSPAAIGISIETAGPRSTRNGRARSVANVAARSMWRTDARSRRASHAAVRPSARKSVAFSRIESPAALVRNTAASATVDVMAASFPCERVRSRIGAHRALRPSSSPASTGPLPSLAVSRRRTRVRAY